MMGIIKRKIEEAKRDIELDPSCKKLIIWNWFCLAVVAMSFISVFFFAALWSLFDIRLEFLGYGAVGFIIAPIWLIVIIVMMVDSL